MIIIFIKRLTWGFGLLLCGSFASFIETITGQFVIDGFWDMQWSGMKIKGSMLGITILSCIITTILQYVVPEANFFFVYATDQFSNVFPTAICIDTHHR